MKNIINEYVMKKKQFKEQMANWKQGHPFTQYLDNLAASKNPRKLFKGKGRIKCAYDYQ